LQQTLTLTSTIEHQMKRYTQIAGLLIALVVSIAAQVPPDDYASQLAKSTPASLPQSPVVKRDGSDSRDDLLKGKVKSIVSEIEYLDETAYPANRRLNGQKDFGPDGNLVRQVFNDYRGNISFVVVYGYIDGKRVSKAGEFVRHSYDPPPMHAIPLGVTKPKPKGDERYTSSWEFTYDKSGRLIKELSYNNQGEAVNQTTFTYDGTVLKRTFCSLPCSLTFTTVSNLDSAGNVIKSEYDNGQTVMTVDSSQTYKYLSFDSTGNWTKREISGRRAVSLTAEKPIHHIEYRTITYLP
jgi:YD repeat-containing protein